jgi:phosphoadenosine phosphosulfate reductase
MTPTAAAIDTDQACAELEQLDALGRLRWGQRQFGDGFALTTSFGIQAAVSLHLVSQLEAPVRVIWVDTGYLPAETYHYADCLTRQLGLQLHVAQATMSPARMEALHGKLWETGQVDEALEQLQVSCWASGVRGKQTDHRKTMQPLQQVRGRWALRPLLDWGNREVYYYMQEHNLPQHPLFEQGYSTVGDWHSSAPDDGGVSGRATRFGGLKQECGIHLPGMAGEGI